MKQRFEMPISDSDDLSSINLFAVDDFLRSMGTSEARRQLIQRVGFSSHDRETYERKNGLPHGVVELAMLMEDKRVQELNRVITRQVPALWDKKTRPEAIAEIHQQSVSIARGLQQLYPEASDFMLQYAVLTQKNRRQFVGDYDFGNEHKLQFVDCFLSCDSGLNCNTNINITVNVNLGLNVNIAAINKVALALIFVVCIAIPVWPA